MKSGVGEDKFPSGDVYVGDFRNGQYHGEWRGSDWMMFVLCLEN